MSEIACTEKRARIRWSKPDDHGDKITKYLVQMHTEFEEVNNNIIAIITVTLTTVIIIIIIIIIVAINTVYLLV